jgi:hypothetical protein
MGMVDLPFLERSAVSYQRSAKAASYHKSMIRSKPWLLGSKL